MCAASPDAVIFIPLLRASARISTQKSKAERKRPQLIGFRRAQSALDPPPPFLPQRRGAFERFDASGREPRRSLAVVLRRT